MAKSRARQGILASISHRKWGLETTVLRMTHEALVNSLLRYGLNITGSGMPEDLVNRLDIHVINPAARRITALSSHARIETLHFLAGTLSYRNLYLCQAASFFHSTLLAQGSQIQARIGDELCGQLEVGTLCLHTSEVSYNRADAFLLGSEHLPPMVFDHTEWGIREYIDQPNWDTIPKIASMYVAHAPEILRVPANHQKTFKLKGTLSWQETALRLLKHLEWRPECAVTHTLNTNRLLPSSKTVALFSTNEELSSMPISRDCTGSPDRLARIRIMGNAIWMKDILATQVLTWKHGSFCSCEGLIHGRNIETEPPAYAREAVLHHALRVAEKWLHEHDPPGIQHIAIEAGDFRTAHHAQHWLETGRASFGSPEVSNILGAMHNLSERYHGRISIEPTSLPNPGEERERVNLFQQMAILLNEHYEQFVFPAIPQAWLLSAPRSPYASEEFKGIINQQFRHDERKVIDLLGELDSESASIISYLDLTRGALSEAVDRLKGDRLQQVILLTILAATRFRVITKGGLVPTACPHPGCGAKDSFWHLLHCYELETSVECGPYVAPFLIYLARKIPAAVTLNETVQGEPPLTKQSSTSPQATLGIHLCAGTQPSLRATTDGNRKGLTDYGNPGAHIT